MFEDEFYEEVDDAGCCKVCGEDTKSLSTKVCSNCELQDRIDNDDSMPHNFNIRG